MSYGITQGKSVSAGPSSSGTANISSLIAGANGIYQFRASNSTWYLFS